MLIFAYALYFLLNKHHVWQKCKGQTEESFWYIDNKTVIVLSSSFFAKLLW